MDKWLWAARFFKTRALSAKACDLGRILSNGIPAKPAREVRLGDRLRVRTEAGDFEVDVLSLSDIRGPAAVAQSLYRETEQSRQARAKAAEERRSQPQFQDFRDPRPAKRNRRELDRLRGRA